MNDVVQAWLAQVLTPVRCLAHSVRGPGARHRRCGAGALRGPDAPSTHGRVQCVPRPLFADAAYDDGRTALLLVLDGTVPVVYRGQVYHIPIHVWFPHAYPHEPPIVLVVPTPAMIVRRTPHVSLDGRVTVPYLELWRRKHEVRTDLTQGCALLDLVHECQATFGQDPPVMVKPPQPPPSPPPAGSSDKATSTPERPPRPPRAALPVMLPLDTSSGPGPARPPKPDAAPAAAAPALPQKPQNAASASGTAPVRATAPAAAPPRPGNPELAARQAHASAALTQSVQGLTASLQHAESQLAAQLDKLQHDLPAMKQEMQQLRTIKALCETDAAHWTATLQAAQQSVLELQARAEPDIEDILTAPSLVEHQYVARLTPDSCVSWPRMRRLKIPCTSWAARCIRSSFRSTGSSRYVDLPDRSTHACWRASSSSSARLRKKSQAAWRPRRKGRRSRRHGRQRRRRAL